LRCQCRAKTQTLSGICPVQAWNAVNAARHSGKVRSALGLSTTNQASLSLSGRANRPAAAIGRLYSITEHFRERLKRANPGRPKRRRVTGSFSPLPGEPTAGEFRLGADLALTLLHD
jgi:hypothetical protein